jgi:hypothetical protein
VVARSCDQRGGLIAEELAIHDFLNQIQQLTADCADALAAAKPPNHPTLKGHRSRSAQ